MHTPAIFIPTDSAFIFITVINMAKWIFRQFLQTHYVLFQRSIRVSVNTETEGLLLRSVAVAFHWCRGLDYQLKCGWEGMPTF